MKTIDLKTYRENKEFCKNLYLINNFFTDKFPDKTWGFVGLNALLYSQLVIENYIADTKNLDPQFIPMLKAVLWQFMSILNKKKEERTDGHE